MRIMVTGAYGLIGSACLARLHAEGHTLVAAGRSIAVARRHFPYARWIAADFTRLRNAGAYHEFMFKIPRLLAILLTLAIVDER